MPYGLFGSLKTFFYFFLGVVGVTLFSACSTSAKKAEPPHGPWKIPPSSYIISQAPFETDQHPSN